jgi:molybdate transport system regulatory protein
MRGTVQKFPKSLVRFRVDLPGGRSIGPGKVRLLELLHQHGSISEAARRMRMSYRQAWMLLEDLNAGFDHGLFETATGGTRGGGARLTPLGHRVVAAYHELEDAIETLARRTVSDWTTNPAGAGRAPRRKRLTRHVRSGSRRSSRRP